MDEPEIAIDFGTARTKVAFFDEKRGEPRLIELGKEKPRFIPSIFHVASRDEGGGILVGDDAQSRVFDDPQGIIYNLKLGVDDPRKRTVGVNRPRVRNSDLLVQLFSHIRTICQEQQFHRQVRKCAITHPVMFEEPKREAIRNAAEAAGFTSIRLLEEPVAAARAWLSTIEEHLPDHIVICDVGGGTTDFALVHRRDSRLETDSNVLPRGFPAGGNHLDEEIWTLFRSTVDGADDSKKNLYLHQIKGAKENLSESAARDIEIRESGGAKLPEKLIKDCCQDFAEDIAEQISSYLKRCTEDGGISDPAVLLIGGGSRVVGLKESVESHASGNVYQWLHAEWAPVLGAALPKEFRIDQGREGLRKESIEEEKYRDAVEVAWLDREIEPSEKETLKSYAKKLQISEDSASKIERDVIGKTKEEALRETLQAAHAGILGQTRELIAKGKGHEAFSLAEQALRDTESDDALDAWVESMGCITGKDRIIESAETIAEEVAQADLAACVRIVAHVTAEASEIDKERCLKLLDPLGEEVRTYAHALGAYLYFDGSSSHEKKQNKILGNRISEIRPQSIYSSLAATGDIFELAEKDPQKVNRVLKNLCSEEFSPFHLSMAYFFDFIFTLGDAKKPQLSRQERDRIPEQLGQIAWGTFLQKFIVTLEAFREGRESEFMRLSQSLLESSFCPPILGSLLHRLRSNIHQQADPIQFQDALSSLEKAVELNPEEDGSGYEEWSNLLIQAGWSVEKDNGKAKHFKEAVERCEQGIEIIPDSTDLRNQLVIARLNLVHFNYLKSLQSNSGKKLAKSIAQKAFEESRKHFLMHPNNPVTRALLFSCCMLKEGFEHIVCVFPELGEEVYSGYAAPYLEEGEIVMYAYDAAIVNAGAVGVTVTTKRIVANTRFFGQCHVPDWETKKLKWSDEEDKLKVGGTEIPYGTEIGNTLFECLKRYKKIISNKVSKKKTTKKKTPPPLPEENSWLEGDRNESVCPHGHGPLKEWEGDLRCWTCGWTRPHFRRNA